MKYSLNKITVEVEDGNGEIISELERETCPCCGQEDCNFSCDESQGQFRAGEKGEVIEYEDEQDVLDRLKYNAGLNVIESLVLAHACAGIDIESKEYQEGITTALDAIGNNF